MVARAQKYFLHFSSIVLFSSLLLWITACGGGSGTTVIQQPPPPAAPMIASLTPTSMLEGGPGFTLTVNGNNFMSGSQVLWNGLAHQTTFISSTQLQAAIGPADAANAGSVNVVVSNPGSNGTTVASSAFAFTVTKPSPPSTPNITSVTPGTITAGTPAFNLTVDGTDFLFSSVVLWNGSPRPTVIVSNTELQAAVAAADIANSGPVRVTVSTPATGGGNVQSNDFGITVIPPIPGVPTIKSLNPAGGIAGGLPFTLAVNGTNYTSNSTVLWNGVPRQTTFISSTQLQANIMASDIANAADFNVSVSNPI